MYWSRDQTRDATAEELKGVPWLQEAIVPHLHHMASNPQRVNTESQTLAPPQRQNYGSDCLLVDILNKKENIWPLELCLLFLQLV